jgi:hypothetical protein
MVRSVRTAANWFLVTMASVLVVGCVPQTEAMPFAPGTWSDPETGVSLSLDPDGTGSATDLSDVSWGDWAFCPTDDAYMSYSGPIQWSWGNDNLFIYVDLPIGYRHSGAVAPSHRGDWSSLEYWACGDLDLPGTAILERDMESPPGE